MTISPLAATLLMIGTWAHAQPAADAPVQASTAAAAPAPAAAPAKTNLETYADKERADLQAFIANAKAELDWLEKKETLRLESVMKRIRSEVLPPEDKAKVKSLQELTASSPLETRKKARNDLQDRLRTERVKAIWSKYKAKKKALWAKLTQDWDKLLMQSPLLIKK